MFTKLETFLVLCKTMNYRITAEQLHLTQPGVTKQIQYLENMYNTKLFIYEGGKLRKSDKCYILEEYAASLQYNYQELYSRMHEISPITLRIGATKTIGDYVIAKAVENYLSSREHRLSLAVDNTERLLTMLDRNELDFLAVEGVFNKSKYDYQLLREEPFIGICTKKHPFAGQPIKLEELLKETIILREKGSGTRSIFERQLVSLGYSLRDFHKTITISSFKLIKEMVLERVGISFVYKAVVDEDDRFASFTVKNITALHEFNLVYLKNTNAGKLANQFFDKR